MKIEGTRTTPSVNIENGMFEIKGRSIPEDSHDFYSPITHVIQEYIKNPAETTELHFQLEYINSGSKKYITNILNYFNEMYLHGKEVQVFWNYDSDDESMLELGDDLKAMVQLPFHIIELR